MVSFTRNPKIVLLVLAFAVLVALLGSSHLGRYMWEDDGSKRKTTLQSSNATNASETFSATASLSRQLPEKNKAVEAVASSDDQEMESPSAASVPPRTEAPTQKPTTNPPVSLAIGSQKETSTVSLTVNPQEQACLDFTESTTAFIQAVHDNAEEASLAPFIANGPKGQEWEFPPLDLALLKSAFGGKKVTFLGDSTLFYMLQKFQHISELIPIDMLNEFPHQNLTTAFDSVTRYMNHHKLPFEGVVDMGFNHTRQPDGPKQQFAFWSGFRGVSEKLSCEWTEQRLWKKIRQKKPTVLVANWGLHMFFRERCKPCNVIQWFHYEDFLQTIFDVALESKVQLLLFKTTNHT